MMLRAGSMPCRARACRIRPGLGLRQSQFSSGRWGQKKTSSIRPPAAGHGDPHPVVDVFQHFQRAPCPMDHGLVGDQDQVVTLPGQQPDGLQAAGQKSNSAQLLI
jgi:hypothetical protein